MNNLYLLILCVSLVTHSCSKIGAYEEFDNTLINSKSSEILSERHGTANNILSKRVSPSSAPSESIAYDRIEKPDSETVHLLIHDDFKKFLKTMPVMTLRKLKNLTLADPEAGHRYLLQLAKDVSGKLNDVNRDKVKAGFKDCSNQDHKCNGESYTKQLPMGQGQESSHSKDFTKDNQYNGQLSSGVGFEFEDPADPILITLAPGGTKMRKFHLRLSNDRPGSTLFSESSAASGPFRPSAFPEDIKLKQNRFPFTSSPNDEGALADIITFGNSNFQYPIPSDRPQNFPPNSNKYPETQGAMGPYSWTIEPASLDKVHSETFLPPTAIFQAISQAEQEELKDQHQNLKHDSLRFHKDFNPYRNVGSSDTSQVYSKFRHRIRESIPNLESYQSRPTPLQNYYPSFDTKTSANTLGIPPGPNYAQAFAPPASQYIPDPSTFFGNAGGGAGDYTSGYLPGPGPGNFVEDANYGTKNNYVGQLGTWMDQAKTYLGVVAKVTGAYNTEAVTRKMLEISIGILGFLAFGGYIAVLLFRPFIPEYLKFPYFPGTVNSSTFVGRRLTESDRLLIIEKLFLNKLEDVIKVAVAEGNRNS